MTKIVCISDTHGNHSKLSIPECDVLIHAGDWTQGGTMDQIEQFALWFRKQSQARTKICVPGNHDIMAERYPDEVRSLFPDHDGVHLLLDEHVTVENVKFWGSPYSPRFGNGWAYQLDRGAPARAHWSCIPQDTNVVITHGPPKGYADLALDIDVASNWKKSSAPRVLCHAGDNQLLERLSDVKPKFHICGHLHSGHGVHVTKFNTVVVNASVVGDMLSSSNFHPIIVHY